MSNPVKRKKILYLVTESEWAGASRYVFDMATHLTHGFELVVAAGGRGDVLNTLAERGIKIHRLRWLPRTIRPLKDFLAFWEILFLYFREKPDVIHLNSSKAGWLGSIAGVLYKLYKRSIVKGQLSIVFTAHGWVFNEPNRANWFFRALERFASRFRDVIICVSENDRKEALRWRIAPAQKLVTIHNGIDAARMNFFDQETARHELTRNVILKAKPEGSLSADAMRSFANAQDDKKENHYLIGAIANLYPNKGFEYLIEAIRLLTSRPQGEKYQIRNTKYEIRCVIIGDGPLRPRLKTLIKKYSLTERILLPGQIPEAWRYLKALDLFVLPSIKEGLPYAILEALAAGVPVVASAVGGIPEIKDHLEALTLVPPADPETLARAIRECVNRHAPPRALPPEFHLRTMLKKTAILYSQKAPR